jgi:hypothetical protein
MHIIKAVCKRRGLTYERFAEAVRSRSGKDSPRWNYLAQIVCGDKENLSKEFAEDIETAFPEIRKEWLLWPEQYRAEMERFFPEIQEDNGVKKASGE